jgi:hypothetical protein
VRTLAAPARLRSYVELVTQLEHECDDSRRRHGQAPPSELVGKALRGELPQVLEDRQNHLPGGF